MRIEDTSLLIKKGTGIVRILATINYIYSDVNQIYFHSDATGPSICKSYLANS